MMSSGPDASNSCLPITSPVVVSVPPLPSNVRGERCSITSCSNHHTQSSHFILVYASNKLVVCRNLLSPNEPLLPSIHPLSALVYRGHTLAPVTAVSMSPSGAYVASGDEKGGLRVWAYDHPDHLCKYATPSILTGAVRDVDWDGESKRLVVAGARAPTDTNGACSKALQWDTGVTTGTLGLHSKGRAASCAFKKNRPYRIVTGGYDDAKVLFHSGPPFARILPVTATANSGSGSTTVPTEHAHTKGVVHVVRYNPSGTAVVSVGTDRSLCLYDGVTMALKCRLADVHAATIYDAAFSGDGTTLVTASGDGTCKLFAVAADSSTLTETTEWKVAEHQAGGRGFLGNKVPAGGVQTGCAFVNLSTPVAVSFNGQLSLLRDDGTCETMTGHVAPIAACAVDPAQGLFYTGDTNGILCQWDLHTVTPIRRLEPPACGGDERGEGSSNNKKHNNNDDLMYVVHTGAIAGVAVTAGQRLLSVGWDDQLRFTVQGVVQATALPLGAQPCAMATGTNLACIVTVAGLLLVTIGGATPVVISPMISIPYEAQAVTVSPDDSTVFVGGKDCTIYIYNVSEKNSLTLNHTIDNGHLKPIHCLALSNNGTQLASADERDVCVWNLSTEAGGEYGAPVIGRGKWCFHVQRITSLSWSTDDRILASGGADDSIYLWSVAHKMTRIHYSYAHRGGIVSLHFLPQNKLLSTGVDSVVNLWDVSADLQAKFG